MHFSSTTLPVALAMIRVKLYIVLLYDQSLIGLHFTVSNQSPRPKAAAKTGYSSSANTYLNTTTSGTVGPSSSAAATSGASLYSTGPTTASGSPSVGGSAGAGSSSGGPSEDETTSSVQFMWQPLSDINYPSITLLASFKVSGRMVPNINFGSIVNIC